MPGVYFAGSEYQKATGVSSAGSLPSISSQHSYAISYLSASAAGTVAVARGASPGA